MAAADTTMEARLAAIMVSLNESRMLLASSAQRLGVKEQEGQVATTASFATTTTPMFMQDRVQERPETKSSPPSLISTHRVRVVGVPRADAIHALTMPTRCSTVGLAGNFGNNHPEAASPMSGTTHPPGAHAVNTDQRNTPFPRFDGTNPRIWRTQCLEYFNRFNIHKCMWVLAATMHMEGKAKVWYEAYRLRQDVGEWSEFMNKVESHFGIADLPPPAPILSTAYPSVDVHASEDISLTTTTRCLNESPKEVMDKAAEPTELTFAQLTERLKLQIAHLVALEKLGNVNQMAEPIGASYEEVLTHVGGVSLFLEPCVEAAEVVFSEPHQMEFEDDVFTVVGGFSLFLELAVESTDGILMASNIKDMMCNEELPDESDHEGAYMQQLFCCDASLDDIAHMAEPLAEEYSHDVLTQVGSSSLFLEQVTDAADKMFDAMLLEDVSKSDEAVSPYNNNTFDLGIDIVSIECWVLELSSPLQHHVFSPGSSTAKSEHLRYGSSRDPLSVHGDPRVLPIIICDTSVWKLNYSATHQWDPGISPEIPYVHLLGNLQLFDSCAMGSVLLQAVVLFRCITDVVNLTLPWNPGEHIYVENAQLCKLAYELLDAVGYTRRCIWFSCNEIPVHPYVVAGYSTRQWDPGILQLIYMSASYEFATVSGLHEGASVQLTHKSSKVLLDKNVNGAQFVVISKVELSPNFLPIILAKFDTCSVGLLVLCNCLFCLATATGCILFTLTLTVAEIMEILYASSFCIIIKRVVEHLQAHVFSNTPSHVFVTALGSACGFMKNRAKYWSGIALNLFWTPYSILQGLLWLVQMRCVVFLKRPPMGKSRLAYILLMTSALKKEVLVNASRKSPVMFICNYQGVYMRTGLCQLQGLDRKLQYSLWILGVHNQMIKQVWQELCKCYQFCSLNHLANHLQLKQWDPGVMWILGAEGIQAMRPERAIAWGQAMFFGGGNVMPVQYHTLGSADMGRGLAAMGLRFSWVTIKGNMRWCEGGIEQNRTRRSPFFSSSSSSDPLYLLLLQGVPALHKRLCIHLTSRQSSVATGYNNQSRYCGSNTTFVSL